MSVPEPFHREEESLDLSQPAAPLPAISAPSSLELGAARPSLTGPPSALSPATSLGSSLEYDTEKPPPGCAPDAIKLFVGSIPKCCTESQLLPFFETIGKVVDLVIVRDKATRESKGSAFLWYANRAHAELAILQFNLRHVLPDPNGESNRPLVLRRAKARVPPQGAQQNQYGSMPLQQRASVPPLHYPPAGQYGYPSAQNPMMYAGGSSLPLYAAQAPSQGQMRSRTNSHGSSERLSYGDQGSSLPDVDAMMQALRGVQLAGGQDASGNAGQQAQMQPSPSLPLHQQVVSVTLPLDRHQLALTSPYMHSIQSFSGARLTVCVGDCASSFRLTLAGLEAQVATARSLLATVLNSPDSLA